MKLTRLATVAAAFVGVLAGGQAAVAFEAFATNNLHLRTGPGEQYPVETTIRHNDRVEVHGCLEGITWCDLNWGDMRGWAAADYIAYDSAAGVKVLPLAQDEIGIPIVNFTAVDAVVPEFIGTVETVTDVMTVITPPEAVSAYVTEQDIDTVYVQGEIVTGVVLPQTVPLYAVPESKYNFSRVNGQNVLTETGSNTVVYVYP
ncbi:DUF1236 domain-containing protein [Bauldia sp.]|uniref:DUF1236 domain-containing protein n=1 Tax=Bauldia sp. TaxID=2575872 RepID=UPI003BACFC34